jgi:TRAP-type uncharacterized transport system substrate-binding protein
MYRVRLWISALMDWLPTVGGFVVLVVASLGLSFWWLNPMPPHKLVLATSTEQSAYHILGQRYRALLRPYGVDVEVKVTAGSLQNLRLLQEEDTGATDVAFVQGGVAHAVLPLGPEGERGLTSLGGLFVEPVWVFYREDSAVRRLGGCRPEAPKEADASRPSVRRAKLQLAAASAPAPGKVVAEQCGVLPGLHALRGWRLNVGEKGSGPQVLSEQLLSVVGLGAQDLTLSYLSSTPSVVELLEGRLDAMLFVSAPDAPLIQMLLQTPGIRLMAFEQAQAFTRKLPFLSAVTLPRGVVDLGRDLPTQEIPLIATTATLVAREGVHPALIQLLMQAAARVHGSSGWFANAGEFPRSERSFFPLSDEAARYYKSGRPWLQRYLPFWLSNLVDRMWVMMLSIMVVLIPLSRLVPPLYVFQVRSRIFRWYARLREVETASAQPNADVSALLSNLQELERTAAAIQVPLSYTEELYALRQHIDMVRERVTKSA